jgi:hypothetical protein
MEDQSNYFAQGYGDVNAKIGDLDEKNRILKNRLLLIGQNLIETREKTSEQILNLKREVDSMQTDLRRIKDFLENISGEFSKFAKKEDLMILAKQAKMFQPLDFVRKSELKK